VEDPRFREPQLQISGDADRHDHHISNDDYTQPGNFYRLMSADQQGCLYKAIAKAMQGVPEEIVEKNYHTLKKPTLLTRKVFEKFCNNKQTRQLYALPIARRIPELVFSAEAFSLTSTITTLPKSRRFRR